MKLTEVTHKQPEALTDEQWDTILVVLANAIRWSWVPTTTVMHMKAELARRPAPAPENSASTETDFQDGVRAWTMACFGEKITLNTVERNHRFLEESLELVQSCGCTQSEAHQLVDYVFHRNIGEKNQETGGVMVTLAALCNAQDIRMIRAGRDELARVWTKIEKIRAKHAAKPAHSPLPAPEPVEYEQISSREWVPKSPAPEPDSAFGTMVDKARIPQPAPQQDDAAVRKESK